MSGDVFQVLYYFLSMDMFDVKLGFAGTRNDTGKKKIGIFENRKAQGNKF